MAPCLLEENLWFDESFILLLISWWQKYYSTTECPVLLFLGKESIFSWAIYFDYHHRWKQTDEHGWSSGGGKLTLNSFELWSYKLVLCWGEYFLCFYCCKKCFCFISLFYIARKLDCCHCSALNFIARADFQTVTSDKLVHRREMGSFTEE